MGSEMCIRDRYTASSQNSFKRISKIILSLRPYTDAFCNKNPRPGTKIARAGVLGLGPAPSKKASALSDLLNIFPRRDGFYPQERPLKGSLVFIAGLFGHRQHIPLSRVEVLLGLLHAE